MTFDYDPVKVASNLAKHGVSFKEAQEVFGYDYLEEEDRGNYGERRYRVVGWSGSRALVLVVVYTPRAGVIRLISARKATKNEARKFYEAL